MKYRLIIVLLISSSYVCFSQSILKQNLAKYSIHLGSGVSEYFFINPSNQPITNPIGPVASFNISMDRFIMLVSIQFGNSKVIDQSVSLDTVVFNQDSKIKIRTNYLGFGYQLISYKNLLIHPYIGGTWSLIKVPEAEDYIEAWGACSGVNIHWILNPKNKKGNYIYLFQNTRFDWIGLKNLNDGLSNFAILPEIGICIRFCPNTKKKK